MKSLTTRLLLFLSMPLLLLCACHTACLSLIHISEPTRP